MNQKSLSAQNKTHKQILSFLKNRKISKVYTEFSSSFNTKENLAVAVSGGPDSLALAYLAKCYAIKNKITVKFFLVDHKLRSESTKEAASVKKILQNIGIICKVLSWKGKKPSRNIQSLAREARYSLLAKECNKNNIKTKIKFCLLCILIFDSIKSLLNQCRVSDNPPGLKFAINSFFFVLVPIIFNLTIIL